MRIPWPWRCISWIATADETSYADVVFWDEEWDRPLTPEEVAEMPQDLREICEFDYEPEYPDDGDRWEPHPRLRLVYGVMRDEGMKFPHAQQLPAAG